MNQNEKQTRILLGVLAAVAVAAWILWPKKDPAAAADPAAGGSGAAAGGSGAAVPAAAASGTAAGLFPLKRGSRGQEVINLQLALNADTNYYRKAHPLLTADGIFGENTESRVMKWLGRPVVTEAEYMTVLRWMQSGKPLSQRPESFPLFMGAKGPKVRDLNLALGIYSRGSTDPKADEYTSLTSAKVLQEYRVNTVSQTLFGQILERSRLAAALVAPVNPYGIDNTTVKR